MRKFRRKLLSVVLISAQLVNPWIAIAQESSNMEERFTISKQECEFLITQQIEEEAMEETTLQISITDIEDLEQQYNGLNQQIMQKQLEIEELSDLLISHFEELYMTLFETDEEFGYLDEEDQQRVIENIDSYREIEDQIDTKQGELYQLVEERQEIESAYDHAYYLLEVQEEEKQGNEQAQKELQTCLLYPYSVKKYQPKNILLNNEEANLASYLVSVTKYMEKLIPAAYLRLPYESIYAAFLNDDSTKGIEGSFIDWPLDQETIEQYTYANELTLPVVQTIAQKAKEAYQQTKDEERYRHFYLLVLQMKEAQYKYFYTINGETFEYLKEYLVDFLNTHQYTDVQSIQQIRAFQQRMQVKLVGYNDDSQRWYAIPKDQSGFYLEYQTKDLFDPQNNEFVFEYEDVKASTWLESNSQNKETSLAEENQQLNKNNQLAALKEGLAKNKTNSARSKPLDKKGGKKKEKESGKSNKELPQTGEVQSKLTIMIVSLLIIGLCLLLFNYRKKRQQKQPLDDLTLD